MEYLLQKDESASKLMIRHQYDSEEDDEINENIAFGGSKNPGQHFSQSQNHKIRKLLSEIETPDLE